MTPGESGGADEEGGGRAAPRGYGRAEVRARDAVIVALAKAVAAAVVIAGGFRAVSDDDFARVVIAEEWARAPKLDPSGTSWLPLPFWITGLAMRAFGRGIDVARGSALALGIASAVVVYVAAMWITRDRRAALAGSILAAVFPWSARLGVATVPELPAAALALLGVASLMPEARVDRSAAPRALSATLTGARALACSRVIIGAAAIAASALSRYEAWPIAAVFAAVVVGHAIRGGRDRRDQARLVLAAVIALSGPAAWMLWNRIARGDALHFLERVAAYRRALGGGGGDGGGALRAILTYPIALARHEPELAGSLFLLVAFAVFASRPPSLADRWPRWSRYARPAAIVLAQIVLLSAAMVKDGAPTHHPERALLCVMLLLAIAVGDLGVALFSRDIALRSHLALAAALAAWILSLRPWARMDHFADRGDEAAIGRAAAALVPPGDRVLIEVADYGYFAIIAALARPEDVVIDRSLDPRREPEPSSFRDSGALAKRLYDSGARYFIARLDTSPGPGRADESRGAWGLFRAASAGSPPRPAAMPAGVPR